jgi:hypothetical protein
MSWLVALDVAMLLLVVGVFVVGRMDAPPADDYADQERERLFGAG